MKEPENRQAGVPAVARWVKEIAWWHAFDPQPGTVG